MIMKKKLLLLAVLLANALGVFAVEDAGAIMSIANVQNIIPGYSGSFDIVLNNTNTRTYIAFGLDVQLPEGFTYTGYQKGALLGDSHFITPTDQGNNTMRFSDVSMSLEEFKGVTGTVLTINFTVDANATSGYAYVKNAGFTYSGETYQATDASALLMVGNGLTLDENVALLSDPFNNVDVTVNRVLKADVWNTICLPFAMTADQITAAFGVGAQVAELAGVTYTQEVIDEDYEVTAIKINFSAVTEMAAHHPYVVKVTTAISSFTVNNVNVVTLSGSPEHNVGTNNKPKKFIGNYSPGFTIPEGCIYLSDNQFKYSGGHATLKGFRGYFKFDKELYNYQSASSRNITFEIGEVITGLNDTGSLKEEVKDEFYNLQGQRVAQPKKGLYIVDNKKVIIK